MKKILIYGGGSQARIVINMIDSLGLGKVELIYDPTISKPSFETCINFSNEKEEMIKCIHDNNIELFHVCIGNEYGFARAKIADYLVKEKLKPISIISEKSIIEKSVTIGAGVLVMPGAIVQKFAQIGSYAVVNTGAIIEHETVIGQGTHVMSGAVLTGRVHVEDYSTICANATVLPDLNIGEGSIVGAGAVVVNHVSPFQVVAGVPAKLIKLNKIIDPIL
ncbi:MAG: hypothetical protein RI902_343 [Pseudomonadota bacterium]|jgi:acetyltransferase EpsM